MQHYEIMEPVQFIIHFQTIIYFTVILMKNITIYSNQNELMTKRQ